jgi:hypothetical protein
MGEGGPRVGEGEKCIVDLIVRLWHHHITRDDDVSASPGVSYVARNSPSDVMPTNEMKMFPKI